MNVIHTKEGAEQALNSLSPNKHLSIDTETTDLRLDRLSIVGISFSQGDKTYYLHLYENEAAPDMLDSFREYIHSNQKTHWYIFHNAVYDLGVLRKYGIAFLNAQVYDTMTGEHLLDSRHKVKKGLKQSATRRLGVSTTKFEDAASQGYNTQEFYKYALLDAKWTYELYEKQVPLLKRENMWGLMTKVEMPYNQVLHQMHWEGIVVDQEELERQQQVAVDIEADLTTTICERLGVDYSIQTNLMNNSVNIRPKVNINSTQQLANKLYNSLGLPVLETTESGAPSVSSSALQKLKDKHPAIPVLLEYKKLSKIKSGFLDSIPEHIQKDGKVRPSFRNTGTETGRLSCSNPNLQQIPRGSYKDLNIRKIFTVPKGYKMISCDYDGQETHVMAIISQDEELHKILREGYDLHMINGNTYFGWGLNEELLNKNHPDYENLKKDYYEKRNKAKTVTFGIAYGKTAYGFSKDFNISEEESQKRLDKWHKKFKGVRKAKIQTRLDIERKGEVQHMLGRKRKFTKHKKYGWTDRHFRQGFNFLIQGLSADMIRAASIATLNLSRKNPEWDLKQVATVHDENLYIVQEEYAEEAKAAIEKAFGECMNLSLEMKASADIGDNYGEAK